jgi:hypothetical protein
VGHEPTGLNPPHEPENGIEDRHCYRHRPDKKRRIMRIARKGDNINTTMASRTAAPTSCACAG